MKLSNRIQSILSDGSDGWEVFYRARAMVNAGEDVIELTIGEHDKKTDPSILDAMDRSAKSGNTGYAAVPGSQELRQAVADRVQAQSGAPTKAENVLITTGGQAGLFATHLAVLDAGDLGAYCDPYYATYPGCVRASGAKNFALQTRPENQFQPTYDDLQQIPLNAKSLLINTPNNPTGVVYSDETLNAIARFVQDRDLWLISDEVYDTQIWEGKHRSPRAIAGMEGRTLVVGSMSKSHAMTGFRVGWIIAPEGVINHLLNLATTNTYGVAGFVQDAAYWALVYGRNIEEKVANVFRHRRDMAYTLLEGITSVSLIPSSGAMYLMLDIRKTGLSGEDFANQLLDAERIAVMPGESFGIAAAGHIRVAMTIEDNRFKDALKRIITFAETFKTL